MPMILEIIQYRARPLGNDSEKKAIIKGIIHSIMVWLPLLAGGLWTGSWSSSAGPRW